MNARRAIFEGLTGIAMRRVGSAGQAYLHPDVTGTPPD
jgi:agmatinase